MKKSILYLFVLCSAATFAQSEKNITSGLFLRGKVLGGFFIEDFWVLTATAGLEYRFLKNFSVGADFVHVNEIYEKEHYYDTSDLTKYNEYAQKNPRTCLLNDIRFYPFQKVFANKTFKPYLAAFSKYGSNITWCVPGYNFSNNDVVRRRGKFVDLGISGGFHLDFYFWGLDFNLGYCQRTEISDVEYFENDGTNRYVYDEKTVKNRMSCRLNLFVILFSKNE